MSTDPQRPATLDALTEALTASRTAPLRMDPAEFRRVGHGLVDAIADFLGSVPARPVTTGEESPVIQRLVNATASLPEEGTDAEVLLRDTTALLTDHSLLNGHPRFFGYITSSPAPIGMLGDLLAAAVNANVGAWQLSPVATEIEAQTVRWIAQLIGYPTACGGLLVSGGNMANMVGVFAARAAAARWDIRKAGMSDSAARPLRIYASAETHTWVQKAADLSGVGTDSIRWIPTYHDQRMDIDALRAAIDSDRSDGDVPMMVVGTAGSVSTGAIDPLIEIARICREAEVWFHIDGAYGALAAAVADSSSDLAALGLADSVAVDPHKWLYTPLEAGCVLVRDAECLQNAFAYHPSYYHFGQGPIDYAEYGPQNSRGFRALKVWLALRHVGRSGYVRMIGDDIRLSELLYELLREHPTLQALTQSLSITTFRYVPPDLQATIGSDETESYLNKLNQALLERIQASGEAFVSNAVIHGRYVLRACIVNFNTSVADVEALPEIVARLGRATDEALRAVARQA
ncbi:MAG TPA: aminotransferase class V-fold PLP-dependent enzyme [Gemmatimonadaceae bacterium]